MDWEQGYKALVQVLAYQEQERIEKNKKKLNAVWRSQ